MATCTRYNVCSETSDLPGLLSWTKAKRKISSLSSVEFRYYPQSAPQPTTCLSVGQILPLSPHVMSMKLLSCNTSWLFVILSPYVFLGHHPPTPPVCFRPPGLQLWSAQLPHHCLYLQWKTFTVSKSLKSIWFNIWFVSSHLRHKLQNPPFHICLGVGVWISPEKVFCLPLKEVALPLM